MSTFLLQTSSDPVLVLVRVALGAVIFPHGAQKVFGWFGGYGPRATMGYFKSLGIPPLFGALAILSEFLGSIALILGFGGRVAALGILGVMTVAALRVHLPNGFFMNWSGQQKGEGYEYHILAAALALVIIAHGSGPWSVDWLIAGFR